MYGMVGITAGGILNIVLDPILIFALDMGTAGAALATVLPAGRQLLSILLTMQHEGGTRSPSAFRISSPASGITAASATTAFLPRPSGHCEHFEHPGSVTRWGVYDAAIAAMSIVCCHAMFINSSVIGFGQASSRSAASPTVRASSERREAFWFREGRDRFARSCCGGHFLPFSGQTSSPCSAATIRRSSKSAPRPAPPAFDPAALGLYHQRNMFTQAIGYGVRSTIISTARQASFSSRRC